MPKDTNTYVNVFYRISTGYVWNKGWMDKEEGWAFNFEVIRMLHDLGFRSWKKSSSSAWEAFRGSAESLYCHPAYLSGWISKYRIEETAKVLGTAKTFRLRSFDTHRECRYYADWELREALTQKKEEIVGLLLESYRTPGKHLFKAYNPELRAGIAYLEEEGKLTIEADFIKSVFGELVASAAIEQSSNGARPTYRTALPPIHRAVKDQKPPIPIESDPETELRLMWTKKGVSRERQDELIADLTAKAQPGAYVGPFRIPTDEELAGKR